MKALALSLLVLSGSAWANGALLFTPSTTQLAAKEQARITNVRAMRAVNGVAVVHVDRFAMSGRVVTIRLGDTERTFAGGPTLTGIEGVDSWSGHSERGELLTLVREKDGKSVHGHFNLWNKNYRLETIAEGITLLIDQDLPINPPAPEPARPASGASR